jgi:hypothetical protein
MTIVPDIYYFVGDNLFTAYSVRQQAWVPDTEIPDGIWATLMPTEEARIEAMKFHRLPPYDAPDISDRQFAHQLRNLGIITHEEAVAFGAQGILPGALQALVDALPTEEMRKDAELLLTSATIFEFTHPLTEVFATAFGWDIAQTREFFFAARALG